MKIVSKIQIAFVLVALVTLGALRADAHCDTMSGPVVVAARRALQAGDVIPVLKWVRPEHEAEVRQAFNKTLLVRKQSGEAQELADRYFFETVVRLHRAGEGEPYDGLKDGNVVDPAIAALDRALEASDDRLLVAVTGDAPDIQARFARVLQLRARADENLLAGRTYVAAYVEMARSLEATPHDESHKGTEHPASATTSAQIDRFVAEKTRLKKNETTSLMLALRVEPAGSAVDWKLSCAEVVITGWKSPQVLNVVERGDNNAIRAIEGHRFLGSNPSVEIAVKRPKTVPPSTPASCKATVRAAGTEDNKTVAFELR